MADKIQDGGTSEIWSQISGHSGTIAAVTATSVVLIAAARYGPNLKETVFGPSLSAHPDPPLPGQHKSQSIYSALLFGPSPDPDVTSRQVLTGTAHHMRARLTARHGPLAQFWLFGWPIVNVQDPVLVRMVLADIKTFERPWYFMRGLGYLATALFAMEGNVWKRHRKVLSPAFGPKQLQLSITVASQKTHQLITLLNPSTPEDMRRRCSYLALDVLSLVMFSADFETLTAEGDDMYSAIQTLSQSMTMRFLTPEWVWGFLPDKYKVRRARAKIDSAIEEAIETKRSTGGREGVGDIIDSLMAETSLTTKEITEEIRGFFFAGLGTTGSTLVILLLSLIERPTILATLLTEIHTVVGPTRDPTLTDFTSMPYLDGVIKESMRLRPTVGDTARWCTRPVTYDGRVFPKHTVFGLDISGLHRNPEYFEDPERFWPERWESAGRWLRPGTFIPFIEGPHRCIGEKMALLVIKTVLTILLREMEFTLVPGQDLELKYEITAEFKDGLMMNVTKRMST